jgi:hypothetical protein
MSKDIEEKVLKDLIKCTSVNKEGELLFNNNPLSLAEVMMYVRQIYGFGYHESVGTYSSYMKKMNEIRMKPYTEEPDDVQMIQPRSKVKNKKIERSPLLNSHTFINDRFL